ncbi:MAG: hypothetical protein DDT33_01339 [Firmicutes bacterium]|nr:hypothetical protein [Bacillota bacterium]
MTDKPVLNAYRLYHRLLGYSRDVQAASAQEACERLGWLIGDVWVSCPGSAKHPPDWEDVPRQQLPPEKMKGE